jgi:hypothetical protein
VTAVRAVIHPLEGKELVHRLDRFGGSRMDAHFCAARQLAVLE